MKGHTFLFVSLFSLLLYENNVSCEVYTAIVDLEEILETEGVLLNSLDAYLKAEQEKINLLKRFNELYHMHHEKAMKDIQGYLSNPINAYTLVKRLTTDWKQVENLIQIDINKDAITNFTYIKQNMKFPTDEDLNGAAVALTRLQDTYRLDTSSLARGELNGIKYSSELSAADCFELGRQSYNNDDFYHTQLWMKEADERLKREANATVDRIDVLEYLAFSIYKQGNIGMALDITNKLLQLFPTHQRAVGNKIYYEEELQKASYDAKKRGDDESDEITQEGQVANDPYSRERYEALCRGEIVIPIEKSSKLKCRYVNRNNPYLLLAPFKVEEAYLDPDLYIFHDVMSDPEIETIKRLAQPRFQRATVQNARTGELEVAHYRISKSAWLKEYEHQHIEDVTRRIEDMTGLSMTTAEELQVVNYGIGGHYEPHFDFARFTRATVHNSKTGEREVVHYRISKAAWLRDDEHKYVEDITRRVQDMTGLTMTTAEELQVGNYGIGGHYDPHFDFFDRKEEVTAFQRMGNPGNRIATVLFYMSDVEQGGATVFPALQARLLPKKGTAAFWYNLFPSGEGDKYTRHAACPVLAGSKWVSNKWIHEIGQEFARPCGLEPAPEDRTA